MLKNYLGNGSVTKQERTEAKEEEKKEWLLSNCLEKGFQVIITDQLLIIAD